MKDEIVNVGTKIRVITKGGKHNHYIDKGREAIIERIEFDYDGSPLYEVICVEQDDLVQYIDRSDFEIVE